MSDLRRENRSMTWKLLAIAAGSFGFGFALVPLYNVLCSVTGYGDQAKLLQKVSAIVFAVIAAAFYLGFIAMMLVRGAR